MQVTVQYEETILRTATCEVDEAEFLEWVNSAAPPPGHARAGQVPEFASVDEIEEDLADLMLEFLQGGPTEVWTVDPWSQDPNAQVYDPNLIDVKKVR